MGCCYEIGYYTRNKTGFLDETCLKSTYANSDPMSNQWEKCNSIVLSWLLNSVSKDLFLGQIFSDNASEVWTELKETYDKLDGEFNIMTKFPKCSCAAREDVSKHNQLIKLMQFLMGLNDVFQPIRSSLLSRETLLDVKDTFAIISREESHRGIASSSFGFVTKSQVGHTVDRCFDIIGYLPGYNKNPGPKSNGPRTFNANSVSSSSEKGASLSFTNEQMMKLMNLINEAPSGSVQANMASRGSFFNSNDLHQNKIVGTGSESGSVYMFDYVSPLSYNSQTIDLNFTKDFHVSPCDIYHNAKQTGEPFLFSDHQTTDIGELIHLDLWRLLFSVLNGKSPFEHVYGFKPKLSHLRSFGCLCFSFVLNNSDKFSARSEKYVLIGFSTTKKAYKHYSLESKMIYYLRDIKFYENIFPFKMNDGLQKEQSILLESSDNNVNSLNFFDEKHSDFQTFSSPNDDGRVYDTPHNDGNVHPCSSNADECEDDFATSMGETSYSKGNVQINCNTPKKCIAAEMCPGALLHNTTAQDSRERPLNVSFEK
ncbi:hypothetical protein Tco_1363341 [Tanacetum coccineum]